MISQAQLRGYRATTYTVEAPNGELIGLRLDQPSPPADALLKAVQATTLCCLNAWNPRSRMQPVSRNLAAHQRLRRDLAARGWRALAHIGVPDRSDWRAEPGFAVLDIDKEKAVGLAQTYGQYGVVFYQRGGAAELLLTRLALR